MGPAPACVSHFALATPSPSNMPACYPLWLDPWQLSLKHLNLATELLGDLVAQLVRAWQAICHVVGLSPSLSHCHFFLGTRPTCRVSDFVYLYCLANRAQRHGRRTCMDILVTSAEYHDCESSFHNLKGYKS